MNVMVNIKKTMVSLLCGGVLLFSGCIKYHQTLPQEFPQAPRDTSYQDVVRPYIRSARLYHQFSTKALFDALWLSNEVRTAHGLMYCKKRGISQENTDAYIARSHEENLHWTTFYVLADVRDCSGVSLSDKLSPWTFYMTYKNKSYAILSVKEIDIEPEYRAFFGEQRAQFKTAYLIKFPALADGEPLDADLTLTIQSPDMMTRLSWEYGKDVVLKKVTRKNYEDFYWG